MLQGTTGSLRAQKNPFYTIPAPPLSSQWYPIFTSFSHTVDWFVVPRNLSDSGKLIQLWLKTIGLGIKIFGWFRLGEHTLQHRCCWEGSGPILSLKQGVIACHLNKLWQWSRYVSHAYLLFVWIHIFCTVLFCISSFFILVIWHFARNSTRLITTESEDFDPVSFWHGVKIFLLPSCSFC